MPTRRLPAILASLLLVACDDEPSKPVAPTTPTASDVLMSLDGIDITFGEVEPIVAFLTASHPEVGRKTVVQTVLEKYLVPMHMARRAFGEQREVMRQRARDLRSVAGNVAELETQTPNLSVHQRKKMTRLQPELPVAMFLFDPLMAGAVSDPIEVPRGFVITGAHEYFQAPLAGEDMADATEVGFFTHTIGEWRDWFSAEQARIADKVTYVHPDYREALPTWCNPPPPPPAK